MLFTDVLNCMQTDDIELKKLVYLYVMNYAKSNPDLAILAVNTFKRDTADPNALIRSTPRHRPESVVCFQRILPPCYPLPHCLNRRRISRPSALPPSLYAERYGRGSRRR